MIRFILRILRLFQPVFRRLGINTAQMQSIVSIKLTIDNRIERNGKSERNTNNTLSKQAILMSVIGGGLFLITYWRGNLPIASIVFHSYLSIVVITGFMTEYARLLFDSNDNSIIERYPVNDRTVLCARIVSMLSYLYLITLSLSLIPYLVLMFKVKIIEAQLFLLSSMVNTLFSLLLANLFYIGLMRFLSAEKFQKIITYTQTFLIVGVAFGYQFIGRITPTQLDLTHSPAIWLFFIPPGYFTAFTEIYNTPGIYSYLLFSLGILLTILLLVITFYGFSDSYVKQASSINNINTVKRLKHRERLLPFLAPLCCQDIQQRGGFLLTWQMTRNNLKFKQSIFPILIYALIFNGLPLYELYGKQEPLSLSSLLFPLYMLPFICTTVILNLGYSEQSNLLWIYKSRPIEHPGALLLGSLKAVYLKYFIPFFLIVYMLYGIIGGFNVLADLILAFSFSTLFLLVFYRYSNPVFPFSKEKSTRESGGILLKMFGIMLLLIFIGFLHYLLSLLPLGVISAIPVSWIIIYFLVKRIHALPFRKIESCY